MTIDDVVRQQSQILNQQRAALAELTNVVKNQTAQIRELRERTNELESWAEKQGSVPARGQTVEGQVVAANGAGPGGNPAISVERAMKQSNRLPEPGDDEF